MQPIPQHKFNPNIPALLKELIYQCLIIDEHRRPSIHQLAHNSYIRSIMSKNGQLIRRTSSSGLKVVQSSRLTHNKSGSQVSGREKEKSIKDGPKIHLMSEYGNKKNPVELGGTIKGILSLKINK